MPGNRSKPQATVELVKLGIRPRVLDLDMAAAYVGLSAAAFLKGVREGTYPDPLTDGRRRQWDIRALDRAVDARSKLGSSSRTDESPEAIMRAIDAA